MSIFSLKLIRFAFLYFSTLLFSDLPNHKLSSYADAALNVFGHSRHQYLCTTNLIGFRQAKWLNLQNLSLLFWSCSSNTVWSLHVYFSFSRTIMEGRLKLAQNLILPCIFQFIIYYRQSSRSFPGLTANHLLLQWHQTRIQLFKK